MGFNMEINTVLLCFNMNNLATLSFIEDIWGTLQSFFQLSRQESQILLVGLCADIADSAALLKAKVDYQWLN